MKQFKTFQSEIKDVDEKGRVLVAANAIGNVDSDKDRSMDGSFNKTMKENFNRLRWFLNHDKTLLLGVPIEGKQISSYLEILGQLNMKKQLSRDVYEDYKLYAEYGRSLEHSVGVESMKDKMVGNIREVYEWKLWEYSTLTSWGANDKTPMLGIKSAADYSESIDWLELSLKKGNYSDEKFKEIELHLSQLRSLCKEPETISTYEHKPNEIIKGAITTLDKFISSS